ncbi:MAG: T9SS type A sorting domain-containing protein [Saprospiraceae bacterium]|nr:T9SS type A sorting domain-containing protein [Saprospiraceae bacterium]
MKVVYKWAFAILSGLLFISYASNPPNGYTGAPGESTCASCHSGGGSISGSLEILGLPGSITPGQTYQITLKINNTSTPLTNAVRGGFQLVVVDQNNNNIGTLSNPSTSSTLSFFVGKNYWEHNPFKNFSGGNNLTWTVDWQAPASATGQVVNMYAACVMANGNGNNSGDRVYSEQVLGNMPGPPPLSASISNFKNVSCFDGSDGFITVSASNGVPPYNYNWSNGQTTATASNLMAGNHSVTVTDQAGGMVVLNRNLTQPTIIHINASASRLLLNCFGDNNGFINLTVSGGVSPYTYKWSNGPTTKDISNLRAGDYTVTVKDNAQCEQIKEFSIEQPDALSLIPLVLNKPDCINHNNGSIEMSVSGGSLPYNYKWNSGETSALISDKFPGVYTCTVTDQKLCVRIQSINLVVDDRIKPRILPNPMPVVHLDSFGQFTIVPSLFAKNVIDNCDTGIVIKADVGQVKCNNLGLLPVKIVATDLAGNIDSAMIDVLVLDTLAPIVQVPMDMTINNCSLKVPALSGFDNCGIKEIRKLEGPDEGALFNEGINHLKYEFEDPSGNITAVAYKVELINPLEIKVDTILLDDCTGKDPVVVLSMQHKNDLEYSMYYNDSIVKSFDTIEIYQFGEIPDSKFLLSFRDSNLCNRTFAFDIQYKDPSYQPREIVITEPSDCIAKDGKIELFFSDSVTEARWLDQDLNELDNQTGENLGIGVYFYRVSFKDAQTNETCTITFGPFELSCVSFEGETNVILETVLVFPNPSNQPILSLYLETIGSTNISVLNSGGITVFSEKNLLPGLHEIDLGIQPSGLYLIKLETGKSIIHRKWILME